MEIVSEYIRRTEQKGGVEKKEELTDTTFEPDDKIELKEGKCRLSEEERRKIGHIMPQNGTASMELDNSYLLFEKLGSEIATLPMGANDINPVSIVLELKEFIMNIKRELCPPDSLLQMPVDDLVKVLAMRLGHKDRWCLTHFGTIAIREPHRRFYERRKIQGVFREQCAVDAPAHVFTPIDSIGNFFHAVNGLRQVLD